MSITHQDTLLAPAVAGRHAGEPVEVDAEIASLEHAGLAAGLPAGLGDSQPLVVRGAHRAETAETGEYAPVVTQVVENVAGHGAHTDPEAVEAPVATVDGVTVPAPRHASLPVRLILTGALAVLVVLALAFVALNAVSSSFPTAGPAA